MISELLITQAPPQVWKIGDIPSLKDWVGSVLLLQKPPSGTPNSVSILNTEEDEEFVRRNKRMEV